jgi:hypothetical protein
MRREPWQRERDDALRRDNWSLRGPNRLVKVVPLSPDGAAPQRRGRDGYVTGYITLAKSIRGMTPQQIETALGLKLRSLQHGAIISNLSRLPQPSEYSHELTADHPGGQAQTWMSDPDYPRGSRTIHQWTIRRGIDIPISAGSEIRLQPGQFFQG